MPREGVGGEGEGRIWRAPQSFCHQDLNPLPGMMQISFVIRDGGRAAGAALMGKEKIYTISFVSHRLMTAIRQLQLASFPILFPSHHLSPSCGCLRPLGRQGG